MQQPTNNLLGTNLPDRSCTLPSVSGCGLENRTARCIILSSLLSEIRSNASATHLTSILHGVSISDRARLSESMEIWEHSGGIPLVTPLRIMNGARCLILTCYIYLYIYIYATKTHSTHSFIPSPHLPLPPAPFAPTVSGARGAGVSGPGGGQVIRSLGGSERPHASSPERRRVRTRPGEW